MTCMMPVNTILNALHRFDEKLDRLIADLDALKHRVASIEQGVIRLRDREHASLQARFDQVESWLDSIGRALDGGSVRP